MWSLEKPTVFLYTAISAVLWMAILLLLAVLTFAIARSCTSITELRVFEIWMSVNAMTSNDRIRCARYSHPPSPERDLLRVSHVTCVQPPVKARHMELIAHGSHTILTLCEVQVFVRT